MWPCQLLGSVPAPRLSLTQRLVSSELFLGVSLAACLPSEAPELSWPSPSPHEEHSHTQQKRPRPSLMVS